MIVDQVLMRERYLNDVCSVRVPIKVAFTGQQGEVGRSLPQTCLVNKEFK